MKLLQRKSKKKGFTLVELMVVIAIIAVLLLVAVPKLSDSTKGAKIRTFEANFRTLVSAANAAYADSGLDATKVDYTPATGGTASSGHASIKGTGDGMQGKPAGAEYKVVDGVVTGKLPKGQIKDAQHDYKVTFSCETGQFTVDTNSVADGAYKDLISIK